MIQDVTRKFLDAVHALGYDPDPALIESSCFLIHGSIASRQRLYHTSERLMEMTRDAGPVETLAFLFHDIIYIQADGGITPAVSRIIRRTVAIDPSGEVALREQFTEGDRAAWLVLSVFGLGPGENLTRFQGLNEFLGALVAARELSPYVSDRDIVRVAACIEGTVPDRKAVEGHESVFDLLASRLRLLNENMALGLGDSDIETTLRSAVWVANRTAETFAEEDVGRFLHNAWQLLPETNPALREPSLYSIREYRTALQRITSYLDSLDVERLFHGSGRGDDDEEMELKRVKARLNVTLAVKYLRVKLVVAALLEALAEKTGGNAPMAFFMGEVPSPGGQTIRLEDFLPQPTGEVAPEFTNPMVFHLLLLGRSGQTSFDLKSSPLSAFIYRMLGEDAMETAAERAREMFSGRMDPGSFLDSLDPRIVSVVARAASNLAFTRSARLRQIGDDYHRLAGQAENDHET